MGNQISFFPKIPTDISIGMYEYQNSAGNVWE